MPVIAGHQALEEGLNVLANTLWDGLPLSIRRFAEQTEPRDPISMARTKCRDLVRAYRDRHPNDRERISLTWLCNMCSIQLLRSRSSARGTWIDSPSRKKPTGHLIVQNGCPVIEVPENMDRCCARVSVAHEIGHWLIHSREGHFDAENVRLPSSPEEEALAEYCARLLLMPEPLTTEAANNYVERCMLQAQSADVTLHAAAARLGDPDVVPSSGIRGVILWRLNQKVTSDNDASRRIAPYWHLCPGAFIPVMKCHAKRGSLIAEVVEHQGDGEKASSRVEHVSIGNMVGTYRVDALAWGALSKGTRLVLSVFSCPDAAHSPATC